MTHLDLCSGYGGWALALEQPPTWVAEVDPPAAAVLAARFPDAPNLGDITTAPWGDLGVVDVLTAGYPCQPFSHAGRRKGDEDERHLWPYIADGISVLRPRVVLLENVAGHLSLGAAAVVGDLARLGYDARWGVVRASDTGLCHRRARWCCVATYADGTSEDARTAPSGPRRPTGERDSGPDAGRVEARGLKLLPTPTATYPGGELDAYHDRLKQYRDGDPSFVPLNMLVTCADRWAEYAPAIARHEHVVGRPAPDPTDDQRRLSPRFVEWMMALPDGWVTDLDLSRTAMLRMLGNGIVPRQAAWALHLITHQAAA